MKRGIFILLVVFFTACGKNSEKTYKVTEGICGSIAYNSKIGDDLNSALDSLTKLSEPLLEGMTVEEYYIEQEAILVEYIYDDRKFYAISYKRRIDNIHVFATSSVIDSKGCYYNIIWCKD